MTTSQADSASHLPDSVLDEDDYSRLIMQHQRLLFAYLRTILNSPFDAEEVLQETCVILWRKRAQFVKGSNFVKWATSIAQNTVRNFRKTHKHIPQFLNEQLLDQMSAELATELISDNDLIEARHRALAQCMQVLNERDRSLIRAAYEATAKKKDIGKRLGMTPNSFYKALNRIQQRLHKCIQFRILAEEHV